MKHTNFELREAERMAHHATQEADENLDLDDELHRLLSSDDDFSDQTEATNADAAVAISKAKASSDPTVTPCPARNGSDGSRKKPHGSPACYGAASVFFHESATCTSCHVFNACDDECLVTLAKIEGYVDVSAIVARHTDGRAKLGRPTTVHARPLTMPLSREPLSSAALIDSSHEAEEQGEVKTIVAIAEAATVARDSTDITSTIAMPEATATEPVAVGRPPAKAVPISGFPVESIHALTAMIDPSTRLAELFDELAGHRDYLTIRREFCMLSILSNLHKAIAPAFRPQPKIGQPKGSAVYFELHRDQLVIDLHWLHTMAERVEVRDAPLRHLFNSSDDFPFNLAWSFAKEKWKSGHRVEEVLYLTPRQQCQLVTLKGTAVAARLNRVTDSTKQAGVRLPPKIAAVRRQLNEWAERDVRIEKHLPDYEALWMVRELLGAGAMAKHVAEIFAVATGRTLDVKTVRDKLKTLDKQVTGII